MGYLNENGLARYDGLIKNWVTFKSGTVDGIDPLLNWQKTETAGAVSFYPLPAAPIDPVVNFLFTETGPAEGTKGPDNPSTITGVTQAKVTRCGKNLFKRPYQNASGSTIYTTTFSVDNETGTVTANTPTSSPNNAVFWLEGGTSSVRLVGGKTYYLSGCPAGGSANTYRLGLTLYSLNHEPVGPSFYEYGDGCVVTPSVDCYFVATATVRAGATVSNLVFKPQLELGSTATAFEPYEGADYTVDLGGTFYGGSVDLSTGVMTVTHKAVVLTGQETWYSQQMVADNYLRCNTGISFWSTGLSDSYCTHYAIGYGPNKIYANISTGNKQVFIGTTGTLAELKTFLADQYAAGTPVMFVSKVPESEYQTIQLTPTETFSLTQPDPYTSRVNTVYSDQVSVQVGYPKSPLATSTELTNAIVSLGGNI